MLASGSTLGTAAVAFSVLLGSASKLDRDLALEDGLAVKLSDGALGLGGGGESHEGVADGARGARVGGDGDGLTGEDVSCELSRAQWGWRLACLRHTTWGPTYTR